MRHVRDEPALRELDTANPSLVSGWRGSVSPEMHQVLPAEYERDYETLGYLGKGSFGVVYKARARAVDETGQRREVAVKFVDVPKYVLRSQLQVRFANVRSGQSDRRAFLAGTCSISR